jgi:hypothetical protein
MANEAMRDLSPEELDYYCGQLASLLEDDDSPMIPPRLILLDMHLTLYYIMHAQ